MFLLVMLFSSFIISSAMYRQKSRIYLFHASLTTCSFSITLRKFILIVLLKQSHMLSLICKHYLFIYYTSLISIWFWRLTECKQGFYQIFHDHFFLPVIELRKNLHGWDIFILHFKVIKTKKCINELLISMSVIFLKNF